MALQNTNSSMSQERDAAGYRTPTEAVRNIVIQWYRSGPDTSPDRVEFMARLIAPVDKPIIPPTRSNSIIPPPTTDQDTVSERPLSPSPGPSHRMEHSNITSITSQKRSQSHSPLQAEGSTNQIKNQDNVKKRKLRSTPTPPAPFFSPPPSPHLSAIPKTFVSINPNLPKVKIENDYNPIHSIKPDLELSAVEGRSQSGLDSDSDSNAGITINIQAVLESDSETESALVPKVGHTKSVVQTSEVNYVPIIADAVEDVICGTDAIPKEAVAVESARYDVDDVEEHSVPVAGVATEVISNNVVQTETASMVVVGVECKSVVDRVKAAKFKSVKTAKIEAAKAKRVKTAKAKRVKTAKAKRVKTAKAKRVKTAKAKRVKTAKAKRVKTAKVNSVNVEATKVKVAQVKAVLVKAAKVKSAKAKAAKVKNVKVKAAEVKVAKVKAAKVKPVKAKAVKAKLSRQENQVATDSLIHNPVIIDTNPLNLVSEEKKILEGILRLLSTSDLLNCRLLSHLWNSDAVPQLRERVQLNIDDNNGPSDYKSKCRKLTRTLDGHVRTFPLSPMPFKKLGLHRFTCQSGESPFLWPEELELLTKHGTLIRELTLTSFPFSHGRRRKSEGQATTLKEVQECCLPSEEGVMEEIKHLLIYQTPNLTSLTLDVAFDLEGKDAHSNSRSKRKPLPLLRTDPALREIYSKLGRNHEVNTKLKVLIFPFNMTHSISAKLLEMITLLAPNLEEIITSEYDYIHFFQPFNRLNLLKSLKFGFNTLEDLELFEKIASINAAACFKDRLKLRHIGLCLPDSKFQGKNFTGFSETVMKARVVKVVNIFLESSKDSLETVEWRGLSFLPESEMWWQSLVMPKVWKLDLGNSSNVGVGQNVLPPAVGWPWVFPNLQCVSTGNIYLLLDCIKYLSLSPSNPAQSVKKIEINSVNAISRENLGLLEAAFPSARVTRKTI